MDIAVQKNPETPLFPPVTWQRYFDPEQAFLYLEARGTRSSRRGVSTIRRPDEDGK